MSKHQFPFYAAVRRGVETCSEPGPCGEDATVDVEFPYMRDDEPAEVVLGFCGRHARRYQ